VALHLVMRLTESGRCRVQGTEKPGINDDGGYSSLPSPLTTECRPANTASIDEQVPNDSNAHRQFDPDIVFRKSRKIKIGL
jgi:hypothetical protein